MICYHGALAIPGAASTPSTTRLAQSAWQGKRAPGSKRSSIFPQEKKKSARIAHDDFFSWKARIFAKPEAMLLYFM
ncbi:hypothetical protein ACQ4V8_04495 [Janthinobacterium sp. LB2P10]|nr:hypothetical protein [Janthinobacterium lividum]